VRKVDGEKISMMKTRKTPEGSSLSRKPTHGEVRGHVGQTEGAAMGALMNPFQGVKHLNDVEKIYKTSSLNIERRT